MTPRWEDFMKLGGLASIGICLPPGEVEMSVPLMLALRLTQGSRPRTLDQWHELCHPADHDKTRGLHALIDGRGTFLSAERRLYCGDGVYRSFRLDACLQRDEDGRPAYLMGVETPLEEALLSCIPSFTGEDGLTTGAWGNLARYLRRALDGLGSAAPSPLPQSEPLRLLLQLLRQESDEQELIVGVVGLASSGKSALVNAMMGERLLPEETRATNSLPVLCRRGEVRSAEALERIKEKDLEEGRDARIRRERAAGLNLSPTWMEERVSERWNPKNARALARIEWTSPQALIPEGLLLVDTPGLDAWGLSGHEELVSRRLLPALDVILYVTPIRAPLKAADLNLMRTIVEGGQELIVLLSGIDMERDEVEAGRMVRSREERLARALASLRRDMKDAGLPPCPIIPIASPLALGPDASRQTQTQGWRAANLGTLMGLLPSSPQEAQARITALRGRRALALLERAVNELEPTPALDENADPIADRLDRAIEGTRWFLDGLQLDAAADRGESAAQAALEDVGLPPAPLHLPEPGSEGDSALGASPDGGLFSPLLLSMREQALRERFLALPAIQGGAQGKRRVLLLGAQRQDGLRILSRLTHDSELPDSPSLERDRDDWLLCGGGEGPFSCVALPGDTGGLQILLPPAAAFLGAGEAPAAWDWPELLAQWVPVLCLDLARIDAGLSDLARSPCLEALAAAPRWVLAYPHGGLFDGRLADLVLDVPERVRAFAGAHGFKGRMDWFVCENYDPRYTDFLALGARVRPYSSEGEVGALAALWNDLGLDSDEPFTPRRLSATLTEVRDRLRASAERLLSAEE